MIIMMMMCDAARRHPAPARRPGEHDARVKEFPHIYTFTITIYYAIIRYTFPIFFVCPVWSTEGWFGGLFCSFTALVCKDSISGLRASSIVVVPYVVWGLKMLYVLLFPLRASALVALARFGCAWGFCRWTDGNLCVIAWTIWVTEVDSGYGMK